MSSHQILCVRGMGALIIYYFSLIVHGRGVVHRVPMLLSKEGVKIPRGHSEKFLTQVCGTGLRTHTLR